MLTKQELRPVSILKMLLFILENDDTEDLKVGATVDKLKNDIAVAIANYQLDTVKVTASILRYPSYATHKNDQFKPSIDPNKVYQNQNELLRILRFLDEKAAALRGDDFLPGLSGNSFLTVSQVATIFNVSPVTIQRYIRRGDLKAIKISHRTGWRIAPGDLRLFIAKRRI